LARLIVFRVSRQSGDGVVGFLHISTKTVAKQVESHAELVLAQLVVVLGVGDGLLGSGFLKNKNQQNKKDENKKKMKKNKGRGKEGPGGEKGERPQEDITSCTPI
jgi:hypothetical protein